MKSQSMKRIALCLIISLSACKQVSSPGAVSRTEIEAGSVEVENGNTGSNGPSGDGTSVPGEDDKPVVDDGRSKEIHDEIVAVLDAKHADSKNRLWSDGIAHMDSDWVVQSPENYWGRDPATLPINLTCSPGTKGCDSVFPRRACSSDDDCKDLNTSCKTLEASQSPTSQARKMCLGSGDSLLDRYYRLMVSAEKHLEIATLSSPLGSFKSMTINALATLAKKPNPPSVRLLVSGNDVVNLNVLQKPEKVLDALWTDIEKAAGDTNASSKMPFEFGHLSKKEIKLPQPVFAWNHAKIVIADQAKMIQGGHNLWDPDYTRDDPVFDISMELSGPLVKTTQSFVDELWKVVGSERAPNGGDPSLWIATPDLPGSIRGKRSVIGIGRMGYLDGNPSDDAILALIRSAKSSLHIAVQDLYQTAAGRFGAFFYAGEPWIADALLDAILKGVKVRVVQSDDTPGLVSYVMLKPRDTFPKLVDLLEKKAKALPNNKLSGAELRAHICSHIEYAPWRFKEGSARWANKKEVAAHTKLVVADGAAFYMGSHNLYPATLQEYGVIVADQELTRDLERQHWDLLWNESKAGVLPCK